MGTADFAVPQMLEIHNSEHELVAVVTNPDKKAGRGLKINESPVKIAAKAIQVPILQPEKFRDIDFIEKLKALNADLFVIVAFKMLPEVVWSLPKYGSINLHASLLPQYRGAAPINHAIINGESVTGVTIFFLNHKIDCGKIILKKEIQILETDNASALHDKLMILGTEVISETLDLIANDEVETLSQPENTDNVNLRVAPKIFKNDCKIDWNSDVKSIHNLIRGLSLYPAAFTTVRLQNDSVVSCKILFSKYEIENHAEFVLGKIETDNKTFVKVMVKDGWIYIEQLQIEGKKAMNIKDFLLGNKISEIIL